MSAPNCLGLWCPKCGDAGQVEIMATVFVRVKQHGVEPEPQPEYHFGPETVTSCNACKYYAKLSSFEAS